MKLRKHYILSLFLLILRLHAQQEDSLRINFNYINTTPQNAAVYLNSDYIGSTPVRFLSNTIDTSKKNEIVIKFKNYYDYSFTFDKADLPLYMNIALIPVNKSITNKDVVLKDASSFFKNPRKVFPVVLSGAVTLGSAVFSFYFKSLANDRYNDYLITGDRSTLDKTKKYDLYSGIGLGVLQISFVSFLYFLLIQ